jgi:hypothetical protein
MTKETNTKTKSTPKAKPKRKLPFALVAYQKALKEQGYCLPGKDFKLGPKTGTSAYDKVKKRQLEIIKEHEK